MSSPATAKPRRKNDPEGLKQRILDAAVSEFALTGLSGTRLETIAEQAGTTKRMVVYHFRSKEALYIAVLEKVYGEIRDVEQTLNLDGLPPEQAIARLVGFTFDYHSSHPEFNRLVSIENIHQARHIAQSDIIRARNRSVINSLDDILCRGQQQGVFRHPTSALDVHILISSLCFFRIANRYTFATIFGVDMGADSSHSVVHRQMVVDAVLNYLRYPDSH